MRITNKNGRQTTLVFKLDALGSTTGAQQRPTVQEDNVVLSGIVGTGAPVCVFG